MIGGGRLEGGGIRKACVFLSRRRTANCRALGYTTLYVLYKEDLSEALNDVTISFVKAVVFYFFVSLLLIFCAATSAATSATEAVGISAAVVLTSAAVVATSVHVVVAVDAVVVLLL